MLSGESQHSHARVGSVLAGNMLLCTLLLLAIGLFMVYNATAPRALETQGLSLQFFKQLTFSAIGLLSFLFVVMVVPLDWIRKSGPWLGLIVLASLTGVLIFGTEVKGAMRWFRFAGISFQPSEMAKIFSLIFFAWYLDRNKEDLESWVGMFPSMLLILTIVALIALEPDLGNAVLLFAALVSMLYMGGARLKHLFILLLATVPIFCYFMFTRFDHIRRRIEVFINPEDHLSGGAYQGHQALIALGSGGVKGKGVGEGLQKLYYLPEAHNDFIFAIVGEDFGLIGCGIIILLYMGIVWNAMQACIRSTRLFSLLLAYGITFVFSGQALFNISVVTGLVPNKGISLPLISYGGSNVVFTLIGLALLIKITRRLPPDQPLALGAIRIPKKARLF
jgi:cell division protein FtsW